MQAACITDYLQKAFHMSESSLSSTFPGLTQLLAYRMHCQYRSGRTSCWTNTATVFIVPSSYIPLEIFSFRSRIASPLWKKKFRGRSTPCLYAACDEVEDITAWKKASSRTARGYHSNRGPTQVTVCPATKVTSVWSVSPLRLWQRADARTVVYEEAHIDLLRI